jgi:Mg2+/Co2+ transporter CorB
MFSSRAKGLNLPSIRAGTLCSLVMRLVRQWPHATISTVVTAVTLEVVMYREVRPLDLCVTKSQCVSFTTYSLKYVLVCVCVCCACLLVL